ncbi:MAG: hypothetical protein KBB94_04510 [Legionellaceae bacterium]|nr:hypothetical protein [Legionellaceae bacterium]MBP9775466.1 hypothetical protein [Legionellaceae bacterium]
MSNRLFSERLNAELDEIGMPQRVDERIETFAKFIDLPKFKAQAVLNGTTIPDEQVLALLARQLEVNVLWLLGKADSKH